MNTRKLYFWISSALFVFLFITGIIILNQLNSMKVSGFNNTSGNDSDIFAPFLNNKPMNILILGGDYVNHNTDTMMVLNYNPNETKISLLSIPRDTKVKINGRTRKINFAYPNGGVEQVNSTLKDLLGIDINYFVYIDTSIFRKIIDILGGVSYNIPIDMNYDDDIQNLHIHLKKGYQTLNGAEAEQFMRFRHPSSWKKSPGMLKFYTGSDLNRIDAQQSFIKEVIKQKTNIKYLPRIKDVVTTLFKEVKTNFDMNNAIRLAQKVTDIGTSNITFFKIDGEDKYIGGLSYYVYNDKILNNTTKEALPANEILSKYFVSINGFSGTVNNNDSSIKDDEDKDTKSVTSSKKHRTKKNPSNSEGKITKKRKPGP